LGQSVVIDLTAVLTNAAQQSLSRSAEVAASPTGVLFPGIALLPLQDPLKRIVHHSPGRVELGYEGVRWPYFTRVAFSMCIRDKELLAHPCKALACRCFRATVHIETVFRLASFLRREFISARTGGEQIARTICGQSAFAIADLIT
jgi:hypothetical protein